MSEKTFEEDVNGPNWTEKEKRRISTAAYYECCDYCDVHCGIEGCETYRKIYEEKEREFAEKGCC